MKKIILIGLVVALLLSAVAGGIAYATNGHNPPRGQKLIGLGMTGISGEAVFLENGVITRPVAGSYYCDTSFTVTNPNCDQSLTLTYLAIMDEAGDVVYEEAMGKVMGPHEMWQFLLKDFVGTPEMSAETPSYWTVEITWTGRASRPLIGWVQPYFYTFTFFGGFDPEKSWVDQVDDIDVTAWGYEMVNFRR